MGAYGPAPGVTKKVLRGVMNKILVPTVEGMAEKGIPFKGCLYAGLMIDKAGNPKVVEYNIRFGDPEAQPTVMLTETDFYPLMQACVDGTLGDFKIETSKGVACCVVMASKGYPGSYEKGKEIVGLDDLAVPDTYVFHAGTKRDGDQVVTAGGRVLGVTSKGRDFEEAIGRAYAATSIIDFEGGAMYRNDIGQKALNR
jgi:phosphoribosylamine--glycine ligase